MDAFPLMLVAHAATVAPVLGGFSVRAALCADGGLCLHYDCRCNGVGLRLPPSARPGRGEDLWRHTCAEMFIARSGERAYREFNFSPSGEWAVYDFSDYRQGWDLPPPPPPQVDFAADACGWRLQARLPAPLLPEGADGELDIGISAVLEETDGRLSYWALHHPAGRPDFHCRDGFVLRRSQLPWESE